MFKNTQSIIENALESLSMNKTYEYKEYEPNKVYPIDDSVLSGMEAFISYKDIKNTAVEAPSGDPNSNYGIGASIAALNNRLHNVPYCPVSLLGKNDKGGFVFNAKLSGAIEDTVDYLDLLECLATMKENDEICIAIDSPGGYIHSGVVICTHILMCKGTVRTNAVGLCASAGSLIWSAGHICTVEPTATLMWHMSSHMDYGNSLAIKDEAILQVGFVKNVLLAASAAKGHITQEEIDRICTNPNVAIYISAAEMQHRIENHIKGVA